MNFEFEPGLDLAYELHRRDLVVAFTPDEGERVCCQDGSTCAQRASTRPARASLDAKLAEFDRGADTAFRWLIAFMEEHQDEILTVARARHITGHFVYGDGRMYEYDDGRLVKEVLEEVADALVYSSVRLAL